MYRIAVAAILSLGLFLSFALVSTAGAASATCPNPDATHEYAGASAPASRQIRNVGPDQDSEKTITIYNLSKQSCSKPCPTMSDGTTQTIKGMCVLDGGKGTCKATETCSDQVPQKPTEQQLKDAVPVDIVTEPEVPKQSTPASNVVSGDFDALSQQPAPSLTAQQLLDSAQGKSILDQAVPYFNTTPMSQTQTTLTGGTQLSSDLYSTQVLTSGSSLPGDVTTNSITPTFPDVTNADRVAQQTTFSTSGSLGTPVTSLGATNMTVNPDGSLSISRNPDAMSPSEWKNYISSGALASDVAAQLGTTKTAIVLNGDSVVAFDANKYQGAVTNTNVVYVSGGGLGSYALSGGDVPLDQRIANTLQNGFSGYGTDGQTANNVFDSVNPATGKTLGQDLGTALASSVQNESVLSRIGETVNYAFVQVVSSSMSVNSPNGQPYQVSVLNPVSNEALPVNTSSVVLQPNEVAVDVTLAPAPPDPLPTPTITTQLPAPEQTTEVASTQPQPVVEPPPVVPPQPETPQPQVSPEKVETQPQPIVQQPNAPLAAPQVASQQPVQPPTPVQQQPQQAASQPQPSFMQQVSCALFGCNTSPTQSATAPIQSASASPLPMPQLVSGQPGSTALSGNQSPSGSLTTQPSAPLTAGQSPGSQLAGGGTSGGASNSSVGQLANGQTTKSANTKFTNPVTLISGTVAKGVSSSNTNSGFAYTLPATADGTESALGTNANAGGTAGVPGLKQGGQAAGNSGANPNSGTTQTAPNQQETVVAQNGTAGSTGAQADTTNQNSPNPSDVPGTQPVTSVNPNGQGGGTGGTGTGHGTGTGNGNGSQSGIQGSSQAACQTLSCKAVQFAQAAIQWAAKNLNPASSANASPSDAAVQNYNAAARGLQCLKDASSAGSDQACISNGIKAAAQLASQLGNTPAGQQVQNYVNQANAMGTQYQKFLQCKNASAFGALGCAGQGLELQAQKDRLVQQGEQLLPVAKDAIATLQTNGAPPPPQPQARIGPIASAAPGPLSTNGQSTSAPLPPTAVPRPQPAPVIGTPTTNSACVGNNCGGHKYDGIAMDQIRQMLATNGLSMGTRTGAGGEVYAAYPTLGAWLAADIMKRQAYIQSGYTSLAQQDTKWAVPDADHLTLDRNARLQALQKSGLTNADISAPMAVNDIGAIMKVSIGVACAEYSQCDSSFVTNADRAQALQLLQSVGDGTNVTAGSLPQQQPCSYKGCATPTPNAQVAAPRVPGVVSLSGGAAPTTPGLLTPQQQKSIADGVTAADAALGVDLTKGVDPLIDYKNPPSNLPQSMQNFIKSSFAPAAAFAPNNTQVHASVIAAHYAACQAVSSCPNVYEANAPRQAGITSAHGLGYAADVRGFADETARTQYAAANLEAQKDLGVKQPGMNADSSLTNKDGLTNQQRGEIHFQTGGPAGAGQGLVYNSGQQTGTPGNLPALTQNNPTLAGLIKSVQQGQFPNTGGTAAPNSTNKFTVTDPTTGTSFGCNADQASCVAAFQQQVALSRLCASNPSTCNSTASTYSLKSTGTAVPPVEPRQIITMRSNYGETGKLAKNPTVPMVSGISSQDFISKLRAAGVPLQDMSSASLSSYPHGKNQMSTLTWHGDGSSGNGSGLVQYEISQNNGGSPAAQMVLQQDGTLVLVAPADAVSFHAATTNQLGPGIEIQGMNNTGANPTAAQQATMQKITDVVMNQLGWQVATHGAIEPGHKDALEAGPATIAYVYQGIAPGPVPTYQIIGADGNPVLGSDGKPLTTTQAPGADGTGQFLTNPDGTLQLDQNGKPIPVAPVQLTQDPNDPSKYNAPDDRPEQPKPANPWPGSAGNPYAQQQPLTPTQIGQPSGGQPGGNPQQARPQQPPYQTPVQPISQPLPYPFLPTTPIATSTNPITPMPALALVANPTTVASGTVSKLSWSSVGTSQCNVATSDGFTIGTSTTGSAFSPKLSTTTLFTLQCQTLSSTTIATSTTVNIK